MRPSERNAGAPSSISAISHDVPPISTVIRSCTPAAPPTILAPITPAAGPERKSRTDRSRGEQTGIQIGEIAVDHGFNVGIKRRDDSALVFAEGRIDLGRERDEYVRMTRRDDLASAALVRIIEK